MKTPIAITSAALLLAITACGGGDTEPQPAPTVTVTAEPDGGDTPDENTDDSDQTEDAEEVQDAAEDEDLAPKDMDFSDDPLLSDREFTGRMTGDVTAKLGDPVEIDEGVFEGIGDYMGTATLTELIAGPECYSHNETHTPVNGHYLFATFELSTDEDAPGEFDLSESDFRWEGLGEQIATYEAWTCQDYENGVTDPVRRGETAQRILVFDIPEFEGTLTYRGATNYVSWEIERDDYANAENLPAE